MEYTNEILSKMQDKKQVNITYSRYYFKMANEVKSVPSDFERLYKKSEYINDCLNLWQWDVYHKNKLMDLQKVNRCKNNRFCPNCRKLDLAKSINVFQTPFKNLLKEGHNPYLLTLTLPNCSAEDLNSTIEHLNKCFYKLFTGLNRPISDNTRPGIKFRDIDFSAALKVLEITYNFKTKTYHPHLHCIVFSDMNYEEHLFKKDIQGHYSFKRKSYNYHSEMDIHLMKLWTMIVKKIRLTEKNYSNMVNDPKELYQVDIKEMDESGIYEVMKYTFKDSDIKNYQVFKTMVQALDRKRIRQGYGELYNLKTEYVEDGEVQSLEEYLIEKENPTSLLTREINELVTTYKEYRKVSRFTPNEYTNIID